MISQKNAPPELSVIIPIYNEEANIDTCIKCIMNQRHKDAEFIFVNDGSTDSSYSRLSQWARRDERIKVINQDNSGSGIARNNALSRVRGKYLAFMDADDTLKPETFHECVKAMRKDELDIVIFGAFSSYCKKNGPRLDMKNSFSSRKFPGKYKGRVFSAKDLNGNIFKFAPVAWNKMYRSSFINDAQIRFHTLRRGQDHLFHVHSMTSARRIALIYEDFYFYRKNNNESIARKMKFFKADALNCNPAIQTFYSAEKILKQTLNGRNFLEPVIDKYFTRALAKLGKCQDELKRDYFEVVQEMHAHIRLNYPNGWWNHISVNIDDRYLLIKAKIIGAKMRGRIHF